MKCIHKTSETWLVTFLIIYMKKNRKVYKTFTFTFDMSHAASESDVEAESGSL